MKALLLNLFTLCSLLCLGACAPPGKVQKHDPKALSEISVAYLKATTALNRPPKEASELKPYLEAGKEVEQLLTSPNDNKPFVILWGTDPRTGMSLKPLVIGYEKTGLGGVRCVFTAMGVMLMEDADFTQANFPPGHKPE
jgi:hypothetical protein